MICTKCGNEVRGNFCPKCGTPIKTGERGTAPEEQGRARQNSKPVTAGRKNGWIKFVAIAVFIAVVIVAAIIILPGKMAAKSYEESLLAYQKYYNSTLTSQYEDIYATIFLDALNKPLMAVKGYNRDSGDYDFMIFAFNKDEVTPLIYDAPDLEIYADGIFTYSDSYNEAGERIYYQARGMEVAEIWAEYRDSSQFTSFGEVDFDRMADEDDLMDDTSGEDERWLTSFNVDIEAGEEIFSIEEFQANGKEYFLKWGTKADGSDFTVKDYEKEYSAFFKEVYGSDEYLEDSMYDTVDRAFFRSPRLVLFPETTFRRQIPQLQEAGVMNQDEFLAWHCQFWEEPRNQKLIEESYSPYSLALISRDPFLFNGINLSGGDSEHSDIVRMLLDYILLTGDTGIAEKVTLLSEMPTNEFRDFLSQNISNAYTDNLYGYGLINRHDELIRSLFEQEITGDTVEELLESFIDFCGGLEGTLEEATEAEREAEVEAAIEAEREAEMAAIEAEKESAKEMLINEVKARDQNALFSIDDADGNGIYNMVVSGASGFTSIEYENAEAGYSYHDTPPDWEQPFCFYEDMLAFLEEGVPLPEISEWFGEYLSADIYDLADICVEIYGYTDYPFYGYETYYTLCDIDKNNVPELIIFEAMHAYFYSIKDGEIVYCGDIGVGTYEAYYNTSEYFSGSLYLWVPDGSLNFVGEPGNGLKTIYFDGSSEDERLQSYAVEKGIEGMLVASKSAEEDAVMSIQTGGEELKWMDVHEKLYSAVSSYLFQNR